jgi:hypothetical protein
MKLLDQETRVEETTQKRAKIKKKRLKSSSHNEDHRPTMVNDQIKENLRNFEVRSTSHRATMGHIVPR